MIARIAAGVDHEALVALAEDYERAGEFFESAKVYSSIAWHSAQVCIRVLRYRRSRPVG